MTTDTNPKHPDAWHLEIEARAATLEQILDVYEKSVIEQSQLMRDDREILNDLLDNANTLIQTVAPDGRFNYANRVWFETMEFRPEDLPKLTLFDAIHPDDKGRCKNTFWDLLSGGAPRSVNAILRTSTGRRVFVDGWASCKFKKNCPAFVRYFFRDITRWKDLDARFRAVVDSVHDAMITIDDHGFIESFNRAAERMFGYDAEDVVGKNVKTLMPEPYRSHHDEFIEEYCRTGIAKVINVGREVVGCRKNGEIFPINLAVSEVKLQDRRIFTGIIRDITDQNRLNAELRLARDAAESADRAKSQFVANISHEIRTPMNGIIGMTELLLGTDLTSQQGEYLGIVKNSAESLLILINELLDFSKIEAGAVELERAEFDLRKTLRASLEPLVLQAKSRGIELSLHVDAVVPEYLIGDSLRLKQIVINLVGNSVKFTEQGKIVVHVTAGEKKEQRWIINCSVTDTGIGIPLEKIDSIFDPFAQADSSTVRKYGGTGLGLSISRKLVELMGGHIWVKSEQGIGSNFQFTIPFDSSTEPGTRLSNISAKVEETADKTASTPACVLKILLVEDNEVNRKVAVGMLQRRGHTVVVAESGREALAVLEREQFDVALMDVQMPEMDGLETTTEIRKRERVDGGHLPIIAMTAGAMKDDRDRCLAAGMDGYLSKPFHSSELLRALAAVGTRCSPTPSSQENTAVLFDHSDALARMEGDESLLREVAATFLRDSSHQMEAVEEAARKRDATLLRSAAHTLKGAAGNLSIWACYNAAAGVERMGKSGTLEGLGIAIEKLRHEYLRAREALDCLIGSK